MDYLKEAERRDIACHRNALFARCFRSPLRHSFLTASALRHTSSRFFGLLATIDTIAARRIENAEQLALEKVRRRRNWEENAGQKEMTGAVIESLKSLLRDEEIYRSGSGD